MLKPHKNDPNYNDQMKKYEKDNSSWNHGRMTPTFDGVRDRPLGTGALKEPDHPGAAAERVSQRLLTARSVNNVTGEKIHLVLPLAERLLAQANGDEHAVSFEGQEVQQYLQRMGL